MSLLTETTPVQPSAAIDYIKLVHRSESDLICFGFLNSDTKKFQQAFRSLEDALQPEFYEKLQNANQTNSVYMSLNSFKSPERKTANVAFVRSVGLDLDKDGRANLDKLFASPVIVEPSIVFESSPEKFQAIWTVENVSVEDAERISRALAAEFGGDPAATDAARVMRLPGFRNLKYSERPEVEVVHLAERTGRLSLDAFKLVLDKQPAVQAKSGAVSSDITSERPRVPRGLHDKTLTVRAGQLRHANVPLDQAIALLTEEVESLYDDYGSDYVEMVEKCVKSIYKHPAGPDGPTVLIGGKLPGESVSKDQAKDALVQEAVAAQEERQQAFDALDAECDKCAQLDPNPYPVDVWQNTPYMEFANICTGLGTDYPNFIPKEFCINALMTVIGAIAGHRIHPVFSPRKVDGRWYSVLLTPDGGTGKGSVFGWAVDDVFAGTGLVYRNPEAYSPFQNIGTFVGDFGSARGLVETFLKQPRILQVYEELSTPMEKFGIRGSGTSFKDMLLTLADSTSPNWSIIGGSKIPANAPTSIYNSLLGSTTTASGRWDEMLAGSNNDTLLQRLNLIVSEESRKVSTLAEPDFTEFRKTLLQRLSLLNSYKLSWNFSPEAKALLDEWYERVMSAASQTEDRVEKEAHGRIQVLIGRLICHFALWRAPLPVDAKESGLLFDEEKGYESLVESTDLVEENVKERVWSVNVPVTWMEDAIRVAEYEIRARMDNAPPEGINHLALCENLIRKHMPVLKKSRWFHVSRKASLDKYGYDTRTKALFNIERQGLLRVEKDPSDLNNQKKWVVVWHGDGRHVKKWTETRGGSRTGSGRKPKAAVGDDQP
jgi:RepB DNA-primase from phage plasmid